MNAHCVIDWLTEWHKQGSTVTRWAILKVVAVPWQLSSLSFKPFESRVEKQTQSVWRGLAGGQTTHCEHRPALAKQLLPGWFLLSAVDTWYRSLCDHEVTSCLAVGQSLILFKMHRKIRTSNLSRLSKLLLLLSTSVVFVLAKRQWVNSYSRHHFDFVQLNKITTTHLLMACCPAAVINISVFFWFVLPQANSVTPCSPLRPKKGSSCNPNFSTQVFKLYCRLLCESLLLFAFRGSVTTQRRLIQDLFFLTSTVLQHPDPLPQHHQPTHPDRQNARELTGEQCPEAVC